jgi:hypothetical protein
MTATVTVLAHTRGGAGAGAERGGEPRALQLPLPAAGATRALLAALGAPANSKLELRVLALRALRGIDVVGAHAFLSRDNLDALAGWSQPGQTKSPRFDATSGLQLRLAATATADGRCDALGPSNRAARGAARRGAAGAARALLDA